MTEQDNIKTCTKCKVSKPHSEFSKNRTSKDGINYVCRECHRSIIESSFNAKKSAPEYNDCTKLKVCNKCKESKPRSEFNRSKGATDLCRGACKTCEKKLADVRLNKNKELFSDRKDELPENKLCRGCRSEKPRSEFSKYNGAKDGLQDKCKECNKEYSLKNKDQINKWQTAYRASKKDFLREYLHTYYIENKDAINKVKLIWQKAHHGETLGYRAKRRAVKLQATPSWFEKDLITAVYVESHSRSKSEGLLYHVDHIIPLQSDFVCGLHCLANLQTITATENLRKSNSHWPDMWEITEDHYTMLESIAAQPEEE